MQSVPPAPAVETTQTVLLNPALLAAMEKSIREKLEAEARAPKPKVAVSAKTFGQADERSTGPIVTVTAEYDADGRLHLIFPKTLYFQDGRDTSSANRRLFVCKLDGALPGFIVDRDDDSMIPVDFALSSTLNLSAKATKV